MAGGPNLPQVRNGGALSDHAQDPDEEQDQFSVQVSRVQAAVHGDRGDDLRGVQDTAKEVVRGHLSHVCIQEGSGRPTGAYPNKGHIQVGVVHVPADQGGNWSGCLRGGNAGLGVSLPLPVGRLGAARVIRSVRCRRGEGLAAPGSAGQRSQCFVEWQIDLHPCVRVLPFGAGHDYTIIAPRSVSRPVPGLPILRSLGRLARRWYIIRHSEVSYAQRLLWRYGVGDRR